MSRIVFLLIFLVCTVQIFAASTYYVDATAGRDLNTGLSESNAWRTLSNVNSRFFSPGDKILFRRGEIWREALIIERSSGTLSSPIIYGAYGSGNKPQINGADIYTGWSRNSNAIYQKSFAYEPRVVVQDKKLLTYLLWKGSVSTTFDGALPGCFSSNGATAYIWCTDSADPDSHAMEVAAVGRDRTHEFGIIIRNVSSIIIQDIEIINATDSGIRISPQTGNTTNNIVLRRLDVSNTGSSGIEVSNSANSVNRSNEITGLIVVSCIVHDTYGHGISLMYEVVGAKIRNNTVYRIGWSQRGTHGITSWSNNVNAYVHNGIIEGNTVYKVRARVIDGLGGTGIQANSLTRDCVYRYNICYNNEGSGFQFNGTSGCKFCYNISYGNGRVYKNKYRGGITLFHPVNVEVYNNVFYKNRPAGIGWLSSLTNGLTIKNNIVFENVKYEIRSGSGADQNVESDYNCVFHSVGGDFMAWLGGSCGWEQWKNFSGGDAHSLKANPRVVSESKKNFNLQATSPCIEAGTNVGLTMDFNGYAVPYGPAVDIGALEYGAGPGDSSNIILNASPASGNVPLTVKFSRNIYGGKFPF